MLPLKINNTRKETMFETLDNHGHINIIQNKKWNLQKIPMYKKCYYKTILAMLSNVYQSSDNLASKQLFKFLKSINHSHNVEAQLPFLKVFHSHTLTFLPDLFWLCLSQCCLFAEFWKVKFGKALKISPT